MIQIKRAYEPSSKDDGPRFLVERLWPRGIRKDDLDIEAWIKDVAPSTELRRWFQHDPTKWSEFQRRYFRELEKRSDTWQQLLAKGRRGHLTLVYSARDTEYNNAVALKEFLDRKLSGKSTA